VLFGGFLKSVQEKVASESN